MRAVERSPWATRRSSRHDEMCAAVLESKDRIFPKFTGEVRASVEYPAGPGYVDVFACTDAPPNEREFAIVEVKTNDEQASAGDIIRQMKWYLQQLRRDRNGLDRAARTRLILVVDQGGISSVMLSLILNEGIEVLPVCHFIGKKQCTCAELYQADSGASVGPMSSSGSNEESA